MFCGKLPMLIHFKAAPNQIIAKIVNRVVQGTFGKEKKVDLKLDCDLYQQSDSQHKNDSVK